MPTASNRLDAWVQIAIGFGVLLVILACAAIWLIRRR